MFIDFTGFACTNCRWMEANVFSLPEVKALLDNFVNVRLYTDGQGAQYDANRKLQEGRFGTVALPLYVIVSNGDALVILGDARAIDLAIRQQLVEALASGKEAK